MLDIDMHNWPCGVGRYCNYLHPVLDRPGGPNVFLARLEYRWCVSENIFPSEAETARRAGIETEKTKDGPLIRWWSTTVREPAQKPPPKASPVAGAEEHVNFGGLWMCRS